MSNLGMMNKTAKGFFWNFLEITGSRGISIVITILLARFLTPDDYGLVAMVSVFFAIASAIMESGFQQALIRKQGITQCDYSTGFFSNILLGLFAYALLFFSANAIATFYNEPRLVILVRVVALIVVINSFKIVQVVYLHRKLDFRTLFLVSVPASIISSLVAVIMAIMGFGVWSLVAQMVLSPLLITLILWIHNKWILVFTFSVVSFKELFNFGSKILVSRLLNVFFDNIYVIVIAKFFSTNLLGCFFFAQKIQNMILHQLTVSIQNVTYPALATIQNDELRFKLAYQKVMRATAYLIFPAMALLIALAEPLFMTFLNPKWFPAIPYLQVLCISGFMYPLHAINQNLLQVKGRSDLFLYLEIFKKMTVVVVVYFTIPYGIMVMLIGRVIGSMLNYIPTIYFANKLVKYSIFEQIRDVLPTSIAAAGSFFGVLLIKSVVKLPDSGIAVLILEGLFGLISFFFIAHFIHLDTQRYLFNIVKTKFYPFKSVELKR